MKKEYIAVEKQTDNGGYIEATGELIRCKNCKHNNEGLCSWHYSDDYRWNVDDYDYCSVGERKEE